LWISISQWNSSQSSYHSVNLPSLWSTMSYSAAAWGRGLGWSLGLGTHGWNPHSLDC
jgi:hypothetical protein